MLIPVILKTQDVSIMTAVIWVVIALIAFFGRKIIGRTLVGVVFGIFMLFFTIYTIDNYTGQNIRNFIDISFYDETLADPEGTAKNVVDTVTDNGKKVNEKINKTGDKLDKDLGITRESNGKVWSDAPEDSTKKSKTTKESKPEESEEASSDLSFTVTYSELSDLLDTNLEGLSDSDKSLIKSMSPIQKATLNGDKIKVTNESGTLYKDNKLKITVK